MQANCIHAINVHLFYSIAEHCIVCVCCDCDWLRNVLLGAEIEGNCSCIKDIDSTVGWGGGDPTLYFYFWTSDSVVGGPMKSLP